MYELELDGSRESKVRLVEPAMIIARNDTDVVLLKVGEYDTLQELVGNYKYIEIENNMKVYNVRIYDIAEMNAMLKDRGLFRQIMLKKDIR